MVDFDAENIETLREEGGRGVLRRERERGMAKDVDGGCNGNYQW